MGHRYIGSKTKILNTVLEKIQQIAPARGHVVDLMCGTASVSVALRAANFKVTAVDVMTYSYHHARVALQLNSAPHFTKAKRFIDKYAPAYSKDLNNYARILEALNLIPERKGYFWKEFSMEGNPKNATKVRNYFSPYNAKRIDGIRFWIKDLHNKKQITDIEHSLLLHDLIMAANDIANISGTYGHYLSKLSGRANDPIKLKPTVFSITFNDDGHKVLRGYAEDLAKSISCDLCYIDPPYMKRQYAANYHILETLAREDSPEAIGESGLRPWRDQYSNFCTKTKIRGSFEKILTEMNCSEFLISYSEDGLLKIKELSSFLSQFGKVKTTTIQNKRFRSNQSSLGNTLTEYLIQVSTKPKMAVRR